MSKILEFADPASGTPHLSAWCACSLCGFVAMHVWPEATPMHDLACSECDERGGLMGVWNRHALAEVKPPRVTARSLLVAAGWEWCAERRQLRACEGAPWMDEEDMDADLLRRQEGGLPAQAWAEAATFVARLHSTQGGES